MKRYFIKTNADNKVAIVDRHNKAFYFEDTSFDKPLTLRRAIKADYSGIEGCKTAEQAMENTLGRYYHITEDKQVDRLFDFDLKDFIYNPNIEITEFYSDKKGLCVNMNNSYRIQQYVEQALQEDLEEFEVKMLASDKEDIFKNAYEIAVKKEIVNFFMDVQTMTDYYKVLARVDMSIRGSLLSLLYDYYIETEYASVNNYEEIERWIGWFCDKAKERMKNEV